MIVAKPPHFKPELTQLHGRLGPPAEIRISKRSDVRVLMPVRRPEQSLGRVQPPIDHHNTAPWRLEAILVQKRLFAERVEFSCRGSYGLWGSNLSHSSIDDDLRFEELTYLPPETVGTLNGRRRIQGLRAARIGD
ncbi:MAG: hypothetical protein JO286_23765 [Solirubrobacterales bacterium]|nr:hypothetical protein [Solirubrobacterales bacterium]MBV9810215.1 hypothetical protein [Solirubrobacterales bacterium]